MRKGETGYLQHLEELSYMNGIPAVVDHVFCSGEIEGGTPFGYIRLYFDGYIVQPAIQATPGYVYIAIKRHQIRPMSDPGAEQETEEQREVVA